MKSVYIHVPFCKNICNYCSFCKFFYNKRWVLEYLDALDSEIKNGYKKDQIYSIYIGGGTPSILDIDELEKLLNIIKIFNKDNLREFTIEFNVEDITEEKLKLLKEYNVNRISIGIQSFNKRILKGLGRNYIDINKIKLAKKYFDNINVDLIYGYFDQTIEELKDDLKEFIKLDINHISTYSLMIEENTKFYNKVPIDEDLDYKMFAIIDEFLKNNNYIHYEISNYCKKGYESKHNLVYWNNLEYYGFGVGAASYINDIRSVNTKNIISYNKGINKKEKEIIDINTKIKYELILGFRKIDGINKKDFNDKYNVDIYEVSNIKELLNKGYLEENDYNIFIPKKYLYVSNEILLNFV